MVRFGMLRTCSDTCSDKAQQKQQRPWDAKLSKVDRLPWFPSGSIVPLQGHARSCKVMQGLKKWYIATPPATEKTSLIISIISCPTISSILQSTQSSSISKVNTTCTYTSTMSLCPTRSYKVLQGPACLCFFHWMGRQKHRRCPSTAKAKRIHSSAERQLTTQYAKLSVVNTHSFQSWKKRRKHTYTDDYRCTLICGFAKIQPSHEFFISAAKVCLPFKTSHPHVCVCASPAWSSHVKPKDYQETCQHKTDKLAMSHKHVKQRRSHWETPWNSQIVNDVKVIKINVCRG